MIALLLVVGLAGASWAMSQPPKPLSASAHVDEFSAERALEHLRAIAPDHPTPIGSSASDDVRDYLAARLDELGLEVEVQSSVGAFTNGDQTAAGRVHNVVATLRGTDPTGRVLLVAHYDTTFGSPGAADDKAAVAAVLETTRALSSDAALRNDVVVLLTDGEEPGMLGAAAYADAAGPAGTDVALNWEATGNAGPSVLFEATPGNAGLVDAFARWAPRPVGDSAMVALYEDSGQNTDLTVLKEAGYRGLNFALIEGIAYYHHSRDSVANLDPASLQHHGATMLALARGLGDADLALLAADDNDRAFFTAFGQVLSYRVQLALPLAVLAAALTLLLVVSARRRGTTTMPRLLAGTVAALVPVILAGAVAVGLWELLVTVRPGYDVMFMGEPFRPVPYRLALLGLVAAVTLFAYLILRRRVGAVALQLGALFLLALLGLVAAGLAPGTEFYGVVPAATAAFAGLLAPTLPVGWWRTTVLAAGALPGVVLMATGGLAVLGVMGLASGYAAAVLLGMAMWVALPLLDLGSTEPSPLARSWALVPAVAAVVLTAVGLLGDRFDAEHPQPAHLSYVQDPDAAAGTWVSTDVRPHPWTARHAPETVQGATPPLPYDSRPHWTGPAASAHLLAPELTVGEVRPDGPQVLVAQIHVTSRRDAEVLVLHVDRQVEEVTVHAGDHPAVTTRPTYPNGALQAWPYELRFYDPPPDGLRVTLRVTTPEGVRPTIYVSDYSVGLGEVPGFVPRPADLDRSADHDAELVVVGAPHPL